MQLDRNRFRAGSTEAPTWTRAPITGGRHRLTAVAVAGVAIARFAAIEGWSARADQAGNAATGAPPSPRSAGSGALARIPQVVKRGQPAPA